MKTLKPYLLALLAVTLAGCAASTKTADVSASIRTSLDQAGFKDVSTSQDRDKGVVTLGGHVAADADKAQAESIARSFAGNQVVANQIAVIPPGVESDAKKMNSSLDKGIEGNLDAASDSGSTARQREVRGEKQRSDADRRCRFAVQAHARTGTGVNSSERAASGKRTASERAEGDFFELT